MTVVVPEKIPLAMPPGSLQALEDLALTVAGVAHLLAVLGGDLAGPGAAAPGWLGADSAAAAAQVTAVAGLTREMAGAVLLATARLSAHADRVAEVRRAVEALREEQHEDHRSTWLRLSALEDLRAHFQLDSPAAVAIVDEWRAAERGRRHRYEALLADLADDAAATARALGEAGAVVGGTGRPGDEGRAVARLAALLPGWGEAELAARGRQVADGIHGDSPRREALAGEAVAYAGSPAFANAFLAALGEERFSQLLFVLGSGEELPETAALLASALGAAVPADDRKGRRVQRVLDGVYVHTDDRNGPSDVIAVGMAAVLLAGRALPGVSPRPALVAEWARQMLVREHVQGRDTGTGEQPPGAPQALADPVGLAVTVLAEQRDPAAAAALLADPDVWQAGLARSWNDGADAFGEVIVSAAAQPGPDGARAVRNGLEVVGGGLFEGSPRDWAVIRPTVAAVSPDIGRAVASRIDVAVAVLAVGIDGRMGERAEALRGLGYVSIAPEAAVTIRAALTDASPDLPPAVVEGGTLFPLPTVAVPAAYLAVQEYGHRLAHALDGFEAEQRAQNKALLWNWTIGLPTTLGGELTRRTAHGLALGLATDYLAVVVDADGTWENPADEGLRFTRADAAEQVRNRALLRIDTDALARQAEAAFDRTATAMGIPAPPQSPEADLLAPVVGAAVEEAAGRSARKGFRKAQEFFAN